MFAGSSAVYGTPQQLPCSEDQLASPTSPYGVSKLAGEQYVHALGRLHGVETVVLRYFNVYGPGQDPASEYAAVIPQVRHRRPAWGAPDGSRHRRDHARLRLRGQRRGGEHPRRSRATSPSGLTCNVATGMRVTLVDLLDAICAAAGREVMPIYGPPREGDILDSQGDIAVARRELGYEVTVPLRDGIARTVEWYRETLQA